MIKKIFLFVFGLVALAAVALAQTQVTGKVTDDKGNPISNATVTEKGTKNAVRTDEKGNFKITINNPQKSKLVISFIGFENVELIPNEGLNSIQLIQSKEVLDQVVVTGAYNSKRIARSTSYNAQNVSGDQLNVVRSTSLNNALAGKVSGIQVRSQSAAALGRTSQIRLRGATGLGEGEDVIYVVDGTILLNSDDINLDDVDDITVLQGPAAAALFGSQGANGAIIITLKKGKSSKKGINVNLLSGVQFDQVYILPNYQNSYAGGGVGNLIRYDWKETDPIEWKALDGKFYHDYSDDASWGPRMIGQEYIPWYAWYGGHSRSYQTAKLNPQPDNAKDFFNTGVTFNNTISFSKQEDKYSVRGSIGNVSVKGLIPNSSLNKTTFNLSLTNEISTKLNFNANINHISQKIDGEFDDGYSNQSTGSFNQWFHRDLDINIIRELKDLKTPTGIWASWNHNNPTSYDPADTRQFYAGNYWYNFYKYFDLVRLSAGNNRLFGDIGLTYSINKDVNVRLTYRRQENTYFGQTIFSTDLPISGTQTTGNCPECKGSYGTLNGNDLRENYEFFVNFSKQIKDFKINATAGFDQFNSQALFVGANTNNGLNVLDLYTIGNSKDNPTVTNGRSKERYNAILGTFSLGYKNYAFIDGTIRNDWYSTLPIDNNAVLSKSVGFSFVLSDLLKIRNLNYLKIRASIGEIPKALGFTTTTFGAYRYPGFAYGVGSQQWNGNFLMSTPNEIVDPNIHGAIKSQTEFGIEFKILNSRLGMNVTYYEGKEKDIPRSVTLYGQTGFSSQLINTGIVTNKGIEIQFNAKPIVSKNVNWTFNATFAQLLDNKVEKIADGVDQIQVQTNWNTTAPILIHAVGKQWGELYGNGIKRINGKPVLNDDGTYVNDPKVYFGNIVPKVTGGLQNSLEIHNFVLVINIDYQFGGKFFSLSDMWGSYSGLTARTAALNDRGFSVRDPVAIGGGVHVIGVKEDGTPFDKYVDGQTYYHSLYSNKVFDEFIYDLTFVKLRELSIGYNLPLEKIKFLKNITKFNIAFVARNPLLLYATTKDFDPSEISRISGESGQFPGTRGYGINLRINF